MRDYLRIAFDRIPISADTRKPITRLAQKCISLPRAGGWTTALIASRSSFG